MKKIGFLIDTSASIDYINNKDVKVLPVKINVNDGKSEKEYDDYVEFKMKDVVHGIKNGYDIKTSQTPYGIIQENIIEMLKVYDRVYCLTISKSLSGQYNSYCQIKKDLDKTIEKDRLIVVDTNALGMDQNYLIEEITNCEKQEMSIDKILSCIKEFTKRRCGGVIIRNLERLIKGGRLTGVKAILAKALNLNLVIEWYNGLLTYNDKSLKFIDAIDKNIANIEKKIKFKDNGIKRLVFYTDISGSEKNEFINYVLKKLDLPNNFKYVCTELPDVVIIYLGIDYFGFYIETN